MSEQIIKDALDGWFFTLNIATQQVKAREVPKNFIPSHKPKHFYDEATAPVRGKQWTEEEDALIIKMFENNYSFSDMGKALKVSTGAVNVRWQEICLKHGIQNKRRDLNEKFPAEVYARVAHLKNVECRTFDQIATAMNLTRNQVAGIWRRWKRNNGVDEEAA